MNSLVILFICCRIANALSSCNATTGDIISTTERLKQDLEITTQRQEIVACFLRDYQLSNEEVLAFSWSSKFELFVLILLQSKFCVFFKDWSCWMSSVLQINALREEDLNENFFKALAHVQEIHANCKVLLRTHHQVTPLHSPPSKDGNSCDLLA